MMAKRYRGAEISRSRHMAAVKRSMAVWGAVLACAICFGAKAQAASCESGSFPDYASTLKFIPGLESYRVENLTNDIAYPRTVFYDGEGRFSFLLDFTRAKDEGVTRALRENGRVEFVIRADRKVSGNLEVTDAAGEVVYSQKWNEARDTMEVNLGDGKTYYMTMAGGDVVMKTEEGETLQRMAVSVIKSPAFPGRLLNYYIDPYANPEEDPEAGVGSVYGDGVMIMGENSESSGGDADPPVYIEADGGNPINILAVQFMMIRITSYIITGVGVFLDWFAEALESLPDYIDGYVDSMVAHNCEQKKDICEKLISQAKNDPNNTNRYEWKDCNCESKPDPWKQFLLALAKAIAVAQAIADEVEAKKMASDCDEGKDNGGSIIDYRTGGCLYDHELPAYHAAGAANAWTLIYNPLNADPYVAIEDFALVKDTSTEVVCGAGEAGFDPALCAKKKSDVDEHPVNKFTWVVDIAGRQVKKSFAKWGPDLEVAHQVYMWDGRDAEGKLLDTGYYSALSRTFYEYKDVPEYIRLDNRIVKKTLLVNRRNSPLGAGWFMSFHHDFFVDSDSGVVTIIDPGGNNLDYTPVEGSETDYTGAMYEQFTLKKSAFVETTPEGQVFTWTWTKPGGDVYTFTKADSETVKFGRLTKVEFRSGSSWKLSYNSGGHLLSLEERMSPTVVQTTVFGYPSDDIVLITLPTGARVTLKKDADNNLTSIAGPGISTLLKYEDPRVHNKHLLTDVWYNYDENTGSVHGIRKKYTYDPYGRILGVSWPGYSKTYMPGLLNAVVNDLNAPYSAPAAPVDANEIKSEVETPLGAITYRNIMRNDIRVTEITDTIGRKTTIKNGEPNVVGVRQEETTLPDGSRVESVLNKFENPTFTSIAGLRTVSTSYDDPNFPGLLPTTIVDSLAAAPVNIAYDDRGRVETVSDGLTCTKHAYDPGIFHAPVATTVYPGGACSGAPLNQYSYTFDPVYANVATVTDVIRGVTVATYQYYGAGAAAPVRGLMSAVTDADGKTVSYEYYADTGWLAGVKNPAGKHTCYAYYPDGLLKRVVAPTPEQGDTGTWPDSITDSCLNKTDGALSQYPNTYYEYDVSRRLVRRTDPVGASESWTYNANGDVETHTDRRGAVFTYNYDAAGRLRVETAAPVSGYESAIRYEYNNLDALVAASNSSSVITLSPDALGRPLSVYNQIRIVEGGMLKGGWEDTLSFAYTPTAGGMTVARASATLGDSTIWNYDSYGRLGSIIDSYPRNGKATQGHIVDFTYNNRGARESLTVRSLPDNAVKTGRAYGYDNIGRLSSVENTLPGSITLSRHVVDAFDAVSRRKQISEYARGGVFIDRHVYDYDDMGQLTSADHSETRPGAPIPDESFHYDDTGNRVSPANPGYYSYDPANRLLKQGICSFTYDAAGNTISKACVAHLATDKKWEYTWDAWNRLSVVKYYEGVNATQHKFTIAFGYDAFGRKVWRKKTTVGAQNPETQIYFHDGSDAMYTVKNNVVVERFLMGAGIDEPLAVYRPDAAYYYHTDTLGSVTAITDETGEISNSYIYSSFGNMIEKTTVAIPYRYTFTSQEWDSDLNMYYYDARWYDPNTGRFISEDIYVGINKYSYVENSPINYVDPFGMTPISPEEGNDIVKEGKSQKWKGRKHTDIDPNGIDCSHYVHEVYRDSGHPYEYKQTSDFSSSKSFIKVDKPRPGDVVLWKGHMGIVVDPEEGAFIGAQSSTGVAESNYLKGYWKDARVRIGFYRYNKSIECKKEDD